MIETKRLLLREYTWKIIMRKTRTKCKSRSQGDGSNVMP